MEHLTAVHVYWNTHKKMWSIRSHETRRVIEYAPVVLLADCNYVVRESGRKRVLRDKRKNVHAWVHGHLIATYQNNLDVDVHRKYFTEVIVSYNPYLTNHDFYDTSTFLPVKKSDYALFSGKLLIALSN